jgi:hypothetical protein
LRCRAAMLRGSLIRKQQVLHAAKLGLGGLGDCSRSRQNYTTESGCRTETAGMRQSAGLRQTAGRRGRWALDRRSAEPCRHVVPSVLLRATRQAPPTRHWAWRLPRLRTCRAGREHRGRRGLRWSPHRAARMTAARTANGGKARVRREDGGGARVDCATESRPPRDGKAPRARRKAAPRASKGALDTGERCAARVACEWDGVAGADGRG